MSEHEPLRNVFRDESKLDDQLFVAFVRERDVACPLCGYNCRNLTGTRCPECGRELRLTLGLVEPQQATWVALVVLLCASGGFGLFCILMVVKAGWPGWAGRHRFALNVSFAFHMIVPVFSVASVLLRRKFLQLPAPTQRLIFTVSALICGTAFAVFMAYVR